MLHLSKKNVFLFALVALAALFGCKAWFKDEPVSYITEPVIRKNIEKTVNATGEVKAIELVTVGAQTSGKIEYLPVKVGQRIQKGDLIAQIDSTTQENDVNSTKAKLTSLKAQLNAAEISAKIAEKQFVREQRLLKKNAASQEDFENAKDAFEAAKAKVTELKASIAETALALNTAETNLGYTKITAPLDGVVVSVPVKTGQTVNAAMNTPTIVQIADLSQMEILIEISEGDIGKVQTGAKVTYTVLSAPETVYETTLKSIDPGLTLLTNGEYTEVVGSDEAIYYYGRLVVDNPDGALRIGMTTQNVIYVAQADNVLTVPVLAVKKDGAQSYVNVLTPTGIQRHAVITGLSDGVDIEIKSGVSDHDTVVIAQMSESEVTKKKDKFKRPGGF